MAPKKPVDRVGLEAARNVLNAVLLADSFTQVGIYVSVIMRPINRRPFFSMPPQRFRPITVERPKCLLPLVNAPMIEYTLEWLAMNKVEEVRMPSACVPI